jgi:hypothetical protein
MSAAPVKPAVVYQDGKGVPRNQAESIKCACGLWANVGVSVEPGSIELNALIQSLPYAARKHLVDQRCYEVLD